MWQPVHIIIMRQVIGDKWFFEYKKYFYVLVCLIIWWIPSQALLVCLFLEKRMNKVQVGGVLRMRWWWREEMGDGVVIVYDWWWLLVWELVSWSLVDSYSSLTLQLMNIKSRSWYVRQLCENICCIWKWFSINGVSLYLEMITICILVYMIMRYVIFIDSWHRRWQLEEHCWGGTWSFLFPPEALESAVSLWRHYCLGWVQVTWRVSG